MQSTVKDVALKFGIHAEAVTPASNSGFSGAEVWRISADQGKQYSVKRLANMTEDHLAWIHRVLLHTIVCDCDFVPSPQRTKDGMSFHTDGDSLWEVCTWVPGEADFETNPSDKRLSHAMKSLAKFHQSAAQVNFDFRPSDGVRARLDGLMNLKETVKSLHISSKATVDTYPTLNSLLLQLKQIPSQKRKSLADKLSKFAGQTLPLQPVIRDLWHDHLLFSGEQLTGLVDFDAMQMDSISLDLTRCLGSIVPNKFDRWKFALQAYSSVRPIQPAELELIGLLDPINIVLSSMNWIKWIVVEKRQFENPMAVESRLKMLKDRMSQLWLT